jgi:hypothetical protein
MTTVDLFQFKRGTKAGLAALNPHLQAGEEIKEIDTFRAKLGPQPSGGYWNDLPYTDEAAIEAAGTDAAAEATAAQSAAVAAAATDAATKAGSAQAAAQLYAQRRRRDLREFVNAGETLDFTGTADASVIIQRGLDVLAAAYLADGIARQLQVPAGVYRLATQLYIEPGVGIVGAGRDETILKPEAHQSGITIRTVNILPPDLGGAGKVYTDCHLSDFWIDCTNQDNTSPTLAVKGFVIQWMQRSSLRRIKVTNSLGTGFGVDYNMGMIIEDCYASGCGRSSPQNTGAGAGFGFATGWHDDEPLLVRNCVSNGNHTHGYFIENKWDGTTLPGAGPVKHTRGFSLIGCTASGNYEGFRDGGGQGSLVTGCTFYGNTGNGASVGPTPANLTGGKDGRIANCIISGNGVDGVTIDRMRVGGYTIADNEIFANVRHGFNRSGSGYPWLYPVAFLRNRIHDNGGAGMRFPIASDNLNRLSIIECEIFDNGTDTGQTDRDGITMYNTTSRATIRGNRIYNTAGVQGTQQYGIFLRGAVTSTEPVMENNDVRVNAAGAIRQDHTITDQTYIRNNIIPGYAWADAYNRADAAALGYTDTGDKAHSIATSMTTGVSGGQGFAYSNDTTPRMQAVDSGSPDGAGTYTVTLAAAGSQQRGRTVARGGGAGSTTSIALLHRTASGDNRYQVVTRSGTTDTLVSQSSVVCAPAGDVQQFVQDHAGNINILINGVSIYSGNIPYSTVPASGRYGYGGTSGASDARYDNESFVPA